MGGCSRFQKPRKYDNNVINDLLEESGEIHSPEQATLLSIVLMGFMEVDK